jgi:WD40 repeat protein/serine/threonine protein kinase
MPTWDPRANDLFLKALEMRSARERQEFLDGACAGDAALRAEVESLLEASARAGPFLESPVPQLVATVDEPRGADATPLAERPGTVIGPYKLLEQIGEGGMGTVFMAEQAHPVRRKVALKIIKPGMDSKQVVARFEAERQALALMDHPNMAHVLDGGETASGRPYFVMELIRGIPITDFCDHNHLPVRQRLELFGNVCQAVQHAHQKGIIHRDLKPSNVLVTLHDDKPVVKVIDFGIAKATGQQLTEKTLFTNFAQLIGTPLYMSPEQVQMSGLDVDTRSDIYSLGVLLYELLTGTTPFAKEQLRTAAFDEIRRIIRDEEPPKPSTRISTLGPASALVSANRQSNPQQLSKLFRGELDWIVMKALEKDRNRRYETANGLARDIERYLHDEPVQACPPSAWYRFGKFARRNKAGLAAAAAVAVAVVLALAGLATSTVLIAREQQATQDALQAATQARDELGKALERERRESYLQRITLAHHELLENNLLRAEELLDLCPADHRAWEWYYLKRLCHAEPVMVRGNPEWHQPVAFSPDGQRLATATEEKTMKIWEATTGQELLALPDTGEVRCAAFRPPEGRWFVTGDQSGAVTVWDTTARQVVRTRRRHTAAVLGLAFSPDGRLFASASEDATVKVWDATTGELVHDLSGHERWVSTVAFSPDGQRLASGGLDMTVKVWDTKTGQLLHTLRGHGDPIFAVPFSPDGRHLASASYDRTVKIWDVSTAREIRTLHGHTFFVNSVAFLDDGRRLASVSGDKTLKIWDATTGQVVLTLRGHTHEFTRLACRPDGRCLASAALDGTVKIWDATPLEAPAGQEALTLRGHTGPIWDLAFSPKGRRLASASWDKTVRVWDVQSGREELAFRKHVHIVFSVAFSPDGRRLAAGGGSIAEDDPSYLMVWDATTGQEVLHPRRNPGEAFCVAFSPDGRWIATGDDVGDVTVWEATTGQVAGRLGPRSHPVFGLAFSPDGRRLAATTTPGMVKVYDATRWEEKLPQQPLLTFRAHSTHVRSNVAFSPDSQRLVVPGDDNTVTIWDVTTTEAPSAPRLTLRGHSAQVWGVAFSPDGRWVASAGEDNTVKLWDATTGGKPVRTFRGHSSIVSRVAFSPDGKRLASGSFDKTVKVWDLTGWDKVPDR